MNTGPAITAGIDGSRAGLDAADWAAREAERRRLPLRLVHAGTPRPVVARVPDVDVPAGCARSALDRAAIQLSYAHPALEIIARHTEAPAVPALLAAAAESETLVVGSRGHTGDPSPAGFLAGSVALAVAGAAERPVVLVRAGELPEDERAFTSGDALPGTVPYRPVVLGLDLRHAADRLIGHAFEAAAVRSAPLVVVHAWSSPPDDDRAPAEASATVTSIGDARGREAGRRHALSHALRPWRDRFPDTPVSERVVHGLPEDHLLRASTGSGLLIIGRRAGERLGRAARTVIRRVTCPIAVVPHG
ncbi:universal stress protein [Streptomyces sp. NPDC059445]|uniref:universal stress protein n=1 Tax=Streptomyces sp. NPDC059445 TaxID=3346832 RepID=UPI0036B51681